MPAYTPCRYVSRGAQPGLLALDAELRRRFGGSRLGVYSPRDVCGNPVEPGDLPGSSRCPLSLHAEGRAVDVGYPVARPAGDPSGWAAARWLVDNAEQLGVQEVIWAGQRWLTATGWRAYSGRSDHFDHVHASMTPGAAASPTLNPGDDEVTPDDLTKIRAVVRDEVRAALDAGTGLGQRDWEGTNRALLANVQTLVNLARRIAAKLGLTV